MMSWRLWRALTHPNMRHPFFRYVFHRVEIRPDRFTSSTRELIVRLIPFFGSMVLCWLFTMLPYLQLQLLMFFPLIMGLILAMRYTLGIAGRIAEERKMGRFDLIKIMPAGEMVVYWALTLDWHDRQPRLATIVITVIGAALLVPLIQAVGNPLMVILAICHPGIWWIGAGIALMIYVDYVQQHLLAIFAAMLSAAQAAEPSRIQARSVLLFIGIQVGTYAIPFCISILTLALLRPQLDWNAFYETMLIVGILLLLTFIGRELLIRAFWSHLQNELDVDHIGLNAILRGEL
jgi:hypothetical protein